MAIVQDHVDPNLLFLATEFGIYFSQKGGSNWIKLAGSPTISFRDLAIQKRENDLVAASFGRSFFVLDDYSPLRTISSPMLSKPAAIYPIKDAKWYIPRSIIGSEGHQHYAAPNPTFGAVFTYHVNKEYKSSKDLRKEKEKNLNKSNQNIPFPGWDAVAAEKEDTGDELWLVVKDDNGEVIRKIKAATNKGVHRTAWDLRYPSDRTITPGQKPRALSPWMRRWMMGPLAAPGQYTVTLTEVVDGVANDLTEPEPFNVVPLRKGSLDTGASPEEYAVFSKRLRKVRADMSSLLYSVSHGLDVVDAMKMALQKTAIAPGEMTKEIMDLKKNMMDIQTELRGNSAMEEIGERGNATINSRFFIANRGLSTTYGPTAMHRASLDIAEKELAMAKEKASEILDNNLPELLKKLKEKGAPYIQGY